MNYSVVLAEHLQIDVFRFTAFWVLLNKMNKQKTGINIFSMNFSLETIILNIIISNILFPHQKCERTFFCCIFYEMTLVNMARLFGAKCSLPTTKLNSFYTTKVKSHFYVISPVFIKINQLNTHFFVISHVEWEFVLSKLYKFQEKYEINFPFFVRCRCGFFGTTVCRSVHGLLWNKQVWIKELAVEGA